MIHGPTDFMRTDWTNCASHLKYHTRNRDPSELSHADRRDAYTCLSIPQAKDGRFSTFTGRPWQKGTNHISFYGGVMSPIILRDESTL